MKSDATRMKLNLLAFSVGNSRGQWGGLGYVSSDAGSEYVKPTKGVRNEESFLFFCPEMPMEQTS